MSSINNYSSNTLDPSSYSTLDDVSAGSTPMPQGSPAGVGRDGAVVVTQSNPPSFPDIDPHSTATTVAAAATDQRSLSDRTAAASSSSAAAAAASPEPLTDEEREGVIALINRRLADPALSPYTIADHFTTWPADKLFAALQVKNQTGWTLLYTRAYLSERFEAFRLLLEKLEPAQIYEVLKMQRDSDVALLHDVARDGHSLASLRPLLDKLEPAQIYEVLKIQNGCGGTPLHVAAQSGHSLAILRPLLDKLEPAQIYEMLKIQDDGSETPLYLIASDGDSLAILRPLLDKLEPAQIYEVLGMQNFFSRTPLHYAASDGDRLAILRPLLDKLEPAQIYKMLNIPGYHGKPLLHLIVSDGDSLASLRPLLDKLEPAQICEVLKMRGSHGETPLHVAADNGDSLASFRPLLDKLELAQIYEMLKMQDSYRRTPLHVAAKNGDSLAILRPLLDKLEPAQIYEMLKMQDSGGGATPLHLIASDGDSLAILRPLLDKLEPAQIYEMLKIQDSRGATLLHLIAKNGDSLAILRPLLDKLEPAQIYEMLKMQDRSGATLLHLIARNSDSIVALRPLLERMFTRAEMVAAGAPESWLRGIHIIDPTQLERALRESTASVPATREAAAGEIAHLAGKLGRLQLSDAKRQEIVDQFRQFLQEQVPAALNDNFRFGSHELFPAMGDLISAMRLSDAERQEILPPLLKAVDSRGNPGLNLALASTVDPYRGPDRTWALELGHGRAIDGFAQMLARLNLSDAERSGILPNVLKAFDRSNAFPGLANALGQGRGVAAAAYVRLVAGLQLPADTTGDLLLAKPETGFDDPGIVSAIDAGHLSTVRAFVTEMEQLPAAARISFIDKLLAENITLNHTPQTPSTRADDNIIASIQVFQNFLAGNRNALQVTYP